MASDPSAPPLPPPSLPAAVAPPAVADVPAPPPPPPPPAPAKDTTAADPVPLPPVKLDPFAAVLSYLIPGLGQVYQGRIGKGLLFFGGLYVLFFYGMAMGQWRNVWLPDVSDQADVEVMGWRLGGPAKALA